MDGSTDGEALQRIPDNLTAGTTLDIGISLTAFPASAGWTLSLLLRGPTAISLTSSPDGDAHRLAADTATTSAWPEGKYWASLRATDGTTVTEIECGELRIMPDLAQVTGAHDGRNHVDRVLDAIEAVIEGRATRDQESYRINNRELRRTPISDLMALRDRYRAEQRRSRSAAKGQSLLGRKISVRF